MALLAPLADTSMDSFLHSLLAKPEEETLEACIDRLDDVEAQHLLDALDGMPMQANNSMSVDLHTIKVVDPPDMITPRREGDAPPGLEHYAAYAPPKTCTPPRLELEKHTTVTLAIKLGMLIGYEVGTFDPQATRWYATPTICGPFLKSQHEVQCRMDSDWCPYVVAGQETPTFQFPLNQPVDTLVVHLAAFFQMDFRLLEMKPVVHKCMPYGGGIGVWVKLIKDILPPLWREGIHVFRIVVSNQSLHVHDGVAQTSTTAPCALSPFFRVKGALPVLGHRTQLETIIRQTALAVAKERLVPQEG